MKAGLARIITIEDNKARYDINMEPHGHFKCQTCETIYDFSIDINSLTYRDLDNFVISDKNVYFKGIYPSAFKYRKKHVRR